MSNPTYKILLSVLLTIISLAANSDVRDDEIMRHLTVENGLTGESVSRIVTDRLGQVWITTSNGINRYNGKVLVTYKLPEVYGISSYAFDICEGSNHSIYVATKSGVFELAFGDKSFKRILKEVKSAECLTYNAGKLYFGNRDGLFVYDGKHLKNLFVGKSRMSINYSVRCIKASADGNIWFLTKYEINSLDVKTGKVKSYPLAKKMTDGAAFGQLAICHNLFYIGTKNNGLWVWNRKNQKVSQIKNVGNVITTLNITRDNRLCVSSDGSGAFLLDVFTGRVIETFSTTGTDAGHNLPSDAVYCYYRDNNNVNWFGFYRQGMIYSYHRAPLFHIYKYGSLDTDGMNIRSFCIRNKECVLGTQEGLWYVNQEKNIVKCFTPEELGGIHIITKIVFFQGHYYIASYDGGLRVLDTVTLTMKKLGKNPLLDNVSVSSLAASPTGNLWMGTTEGLFILNKNGSLIRYTENNAKIYGGSMNDILFDGKNQAWLTASGGLSIYSFNTRQFDNSYFPNGYFNKEGSLKGCIGHDGLLFFSSHTNVFYTDRAMKKFGELHLPDGILNETCYSFMDDKLGHYWIATENGIFRIDYDMTMLQHFGYGEGLRSQIVNSIYVDKNGIVWLATSKGLLSVSSEDLAAWQNYADYKTLLYDVYLGTDLLSAGEESIVNETGNIKLSWNFTSVPLSVKPVLEDYARPFGRLYEYRMDGDSGWKLSKDGNAIKINNLFLGRHRLKVRLAGAPGTEKTYVITVLPSWLAVLELILLVILVLLLVLWRRYRKNADLVVEERDAMSDALQEVEAEQQKVENEKVEPRKYEHVRLDEKECNSIVRQMREYIENNKVYTNPDLKMSDLADFLHLSSSKLSQIFSLYIKENYYEFINKYRLEEFKRLVAEGETSKFTIIALSEKCGFKKSSFFSTFRKVEGMTPTEYLKKNI